MKNLSIGFMGKLTIFFSFPSDARMCEFDKMCLVQEPKSHKVVGGSAVTAHVNHISAKGAGL